MRMERDYHRAVIAKAFEHRRGVHCGSIAMVVVLRCLGIELSEPLAFGLGAGCSFTLHAGNTRLTPSQLLRLFTGCSLVFEADLCAAFGGRLVRFECWPDVRERLLGGRPALAWIDLFALG